MIRDLLPWKKKDAELVRHEAPAWPVQEARQRIDDLFDNFFGDFGSRGLFPSRRFGSAFADLSPSFDISETDDDIKVAAELPGMDEKDIEVNLENNMLTVRGEKREERDETKKNYHVRERSYGSFERAFPLPEGLDKEHVRATFKKGVLNITLHKTEKAKAQYKKIAITAE